MLHTQDEQQQGIPAEAFFKESNNTFERFCVPMVIVGGGTAAWSALEAIYEKDPSAQVFITCLVRIGIYLLLE